MEDSGSNMAPRHPTPDAVIASDDRPTAHETITHPAGASTTVEGYPNAMLDVHSPHGAAKIHDQEKRKRDNRNVAWFSCGGLLIVAIFVFVLWRMRLL
jgi:hypothetical protein